MQSVTIKQFENRCTKQIFEDGSLTREQRQEFKELALKLVEDKDENLQILLPKKKAK
jgi:hypothetical protein